MSADGSRIATGGYSGSVGLWRPEDLRLLMALEARRWVTELRFVGDDTRLLASLTNGTLELWDTVPVRERVPSYERARALRNRARGLVDEMNTEVLDPDMLLEAVEARGDLEAPLREAALRLAHRRRATYEAYVRRMWRDLTPRVGDAAKQRVALSLARGLWRATRHREEPDPRCDTLLAMAYYRLGDPGRALEVFAQVSRRNEALAPELHAVDLAFATLAHAALAQTEDARTHLARLERLIAEKPHVATDRLHGFVAECRVAVPPP